MIRKQRRRVLLFDKVCWWQIQRVSGVAICGEPGDVANGLCIYHERQAKQGKWTARRQQEEARKAEQERTAEKLGRLFREIDS